MLEISIPGGNILKLKHLVLDYNGTLAFDGNLIDGVKESLCKISKDINIHIITADTFGMVKEALKGLPCNITIMGEKDQDLNKLLYIQKLDINHTACIGNGKNDRLMLDRAILGIAVILGEGACTHTVLAADIVFTNIISALAVFTNPLRLKATLRI